MKDDKQARIDEKTYLSPRLQEVLFEGPTPGQSLTKDPDERYPWEGPPKYVSLKDAREQIFLNMIEPQNLKNIQQLMLNDLSVNTIAQVILKDGFEKGAWNPDLMLQLLEPTMYMLLAVAERSGIEPIVESDIEPEDEESSARVASVSNGFIKEGGRFQDARVREVREESVGKEIAKKLKEAPMPSLLDRRNKDVR